MNYRAIQLHGRDGTLRGIAKVDSDVDLGEWRWHLTGQGYAARSTRKPRKRMIYMHREVLGMERGDRLSVDHINGDKLDNRRSNLRVVSMSENGLNRHGRGSGTSRFRGVCWNKQRSKWRAQVSYEERNHCLGDFVREADAARAVLAFLAECDLVAAANASTAFAETLTPDEWEQQRTGALDRLRELDTADGLLRP